MAQSPDIASILAAVSTLTDWQDIMRVKNAIEKRLVDVPTPKYKASEVKQRFAGVKRVQLVGLQDRHLNGMEVDLVDIMQTNIVVLINKYGTPQRTRIPAVCAIPIS